MPLDSPVVNLHPTGQCHRALVVQTKKSESEISPTMAEEEKWRNFGQEVTIALLRHYTISNSPSLRSLTVSIVFSLYLPLVIALPLPLPDSGGADT